MAHNWPLNSVSRPAGSGSSSCIVWGRIPRFSLSVSEWWAVSGSLCLEGFQCMEGFQMRDPVEAFQ